VTRSAPVAAQRAAALFAAFDASESSTVDRGKVADAGLTAKQGQPFSTLLGGLVERTDQTEAPSPEGPSSHVTFSVVSAKQGLAGLNPGATKGEHSRATAKGSQAQTSISADLIPLFTPSAANPIAPPIVRRDLETLSPTLADTPEDGPAPVSALLAGASSGHAGNKNVQNVPERADGPSLHTAASLRSPAALPGAATFQTGAASQPTSTFEDATSFDSSGPPARPSQLIPAKVHSTAQAQATPQPDLPVDGERSDLVGYTSRPSVGKKPASRIAIPASPGVELPLSLDAQQKALLNATQPNPVEVQQSALPTPGIEAQWTISQVQTPPALEQISLDRDTQAKANTAADSQGRAPTRVPESFQSIDPAEGMRLTSGNSTSKTVTSVLASSGPQVNTKAPLEASPTSGADRSARSAKVAFTARLTPLAETPGSATDNTPLGEAQNFLESATALSQTPAEPHPVIPASESVMATPPYAEPAAAGPAADNENAGESDDQKPTDQTSGGKEQPTGKGFVKNFEQSQEPETAPAALRPETAVSTMQSFAGQAPGSTAGASPIASAPKGDSGPRAAEVPAPTESGPISQTQVSSHTPVRDIQLQLNHGEQRVDVRLTEHGGEVRVAVRTPDPQLAGSLRDDLPQLSTRLEQTGFRAETWHPAITEAPSGIERRMPAGSSSFSGEQQGGQNQSRQGGQEQQQAPRQPKPAVAQGATNSQRKDFAWLMSQLP
jgi:hypothetical protein